MTVPTARPLRRILGLGFGLALAFGCTIGVGILRLPGMVAAALGDRTLITVFWALGGLYALMGAVAVAELAAMIPETGGFRVYARRAYGDAVGFAVGWCDWLTNVASLAFASITAATFIGVLWPPATAYPTALALAILGAFTGIHWVGLRLGSSLTKIITVVIALLLITLVVCCFFVVPAAPAPTAPLPNSAASLPWASLAMLFAVVPALRAILTAFDGWYAPIYMAEENTHPVRTLPRAIIGGTLLIAALYLLINLAFVRVIPVPVLAASKLPAADAARLVFPRGGTQFVTVISLFTILSLLNNIMLTTPRILYAIARDGLFTARAAAVSAGGTPRLALAMTSIMVVAVILSGTFEQVVAMYAVLFLLSYVSTFLAVFVLRYREPATARPFRAFAYPFSTAVVLIGSVAFLVAAAIEDVRSAVIAAVFVGACIPVYAWLARGKRLGTRLAAAEARTGLS
jgi:basic amino acid/polyamine antiporter, APA family